MKTLMRLCGCAGSSHRPIVANAIITKINIMRLLLHKHNKSRSLRIRLIADESVHTSPFVDNTHRGGLHIHVVLQCMCKQ